MHDEQLGHGQLMGIEHATQAIRLPVGVVHRFLGQDLMIVGPSSADVDQIEAQFVDNDGSLLDRQITKAEGGTGYSNQEGT